MGVPIMSKTILVVDDDPTQRRLIQGVLEREGFAAALAESGEQAIDHLVAGKPAEVILLDLSMPGLGVPDLGPADSTVSGRGRGPAALTRDSGLRNSAFTPSP